MAQKVAVYKGRKYRLEWMGSTKYGERARLAFFDGSKEFWVDADKVEVQASTSRSGSRSGRCRDCGGPIEDAPHHRAMGGLCGTCAFDEYDM